MLSAVTTKDELWALAKSNPELVLLILEHTKGFWVELGYCYKAVELCDLIIGLINSETEIVDLHGITYELNKSAYGIELADRAAMLKADYYKLQQENI